MTAGSLTPRPPEVRGQGLEHRAHRNLVTRPNGRGELGPHEDDNATTPFPLLDALADASIPHCELKAAGGIPDIRGQTSSGGKLGRYTLASKLGTGAFGSVFLAHDSMLDRAVALKVLDPSYAASPDVLQRFIVEARAAARVRHPGVVQVHDLGHAETAFGIAAYIAMEILDGESLTARLERVGSIPAPAVIEMTRQMASALATAHRAQVLHRDLKPDNIFLVEDPAVPTGERIKILDFGLAKLDGGLTHGKIVFGTPHYMSPEQCRSSAVDHRSDIYSLGCIMFELLCGKPPFDTPGFPDVDGGYREIMLAHMESPVRRVSTLSAHFIPPALDRLIASMLEKNPDKRPQSMLAVQHALFDAQHDAPRASATAISISIAQLNHLDAEATLDGNLRASQLLMPPPPQMAAPMPPQMSTSPLGSAPRLAPATDSLASVQPVSQREPTQMIYPTYAKRRRVAGLVAMIVVLAAAVTGGAWLLHEYDTPATVSTTVSK